MARKKSNVGKLEASEAADTATFTGKTHVQLSFRIDPELHQKLRRAADEHRTTINAEIKWRIDRTFEQDLARRQEEIVRDMEINWHRWAERIFELSLRDDILSALVERNYAKAEAFAVEILKARAIIARERSEKDSRDAAAIERFRAQSSTQK